MTITLPPLPYAETALAPHISARTLSLHHGRHHAGYVARVNHLIGGASLQDSTLGEIVVAAEPGELFNSAAQAWNHDFYWHCMTPGGGGDPSGDLAARIDRDFGSVDAFKTEFAAAARSKFGSGWVWLVNTGSGLRIVSTDDAGTPITDGLNPLLTIDVWEHAYYLDYQNARAAYIDAFIEHLVDWEFAAACYKSELSAGSYG